MNTLTCMLCVERSVPERLYTCCDVIEGASLNEIRPVGNFNSSMAENVLSRLLVDLTGLHLGAHERLGALKH